MGVVYQAWQPQLARRVAIKVLSVSIGIGPEDRRRWLREAQAIGRVRHPNVVRLHEAGDRDGCLYLVLDLIAGGSLADRLAGPLPARVAVKCMLTVARAVDQIHRAGLLHLDIKPSNILLDGPAEGPWDQIIPMLADFGISRAGDDPAATSTGPMGVGGTPSFMAPEQIAGDRSAIGPRSDVFALGATLYNLLTGRPPFQAASVIETLDLVRTREPAPMRTLVPGLPRDLETIALTCLRKDPPRRYASAGALADDLQRWLDGFPIMARRGSAIEHVGRWCRRRPAVASLLAVFAGFVTSSLLGLCLLWRQTEFERVRAQNALAQALDSENTTSSAIGKFVDLLTMLEAAPELLPSDRLERSSRIARDLTAKLRQNPRFATSNLVAICNLENQLAEDFYCRAKLDESRALLLDILPLLEDRRRAAHDPEVDKTLAKTLMELGMVAGTGRQFNEAIVYFRRAEAVLEGLVQEAQHLDAVMTMDIVRGRIAALLDRLGLAEERRQLLQTHVGLLDHLNDSGKADPAIGLLATLTRGELAADDSTIAAIRTAVRRLPTKKRLDEHLEVRLGEWIIRGINPCPSAQGRAGEPANWLDPEAYADQVIQTLESRCAAIGLDPFWFPPMSLRLSNIVASQACVLRQKDQLDDARLTVAFFSAFAKKLARRDPQEAAFHLLRSDAFAQESKNAWQVPDFITIEQSLRGALDEARTALRLDPRNTDTRLRIASLQDKLIALPSGPFSSR